MSEAGAWFSGFPLLPHREDLLEAAAPVNPLVTTNWEAAYQSDCILVSTKFNDLCVKLILNRLSLVDSLHLGLCCRRLYSQWIEERKTTRAAEIARCEHLLNLNKSIFNKGNINRAARDPNDEALAEEGLVKLALFTRQDDHQLLTKLDHFARTFVNLRYLEVSVRLRAEDQYGFLFTRLAKSLHQLTTLKLCPAQPEPDHNRYSLDIFWHSLARFRHPTLKHLTLVFHDKLSYDIIEDSDRPIFRLPQLPILQQLHCFSCHLNTRLTTLAQVVTQLMMVDLPFGAHLEPGTGARFGLTLNWSKDASKLPQPELLLLLPYLTYLHVTIKWMDFEEKIAEAAKAALLGALPAMRHLQTAKLTINSLKTADFPALLAALASLPHLTELTLDLSSDWEFGSRGAWPAASLPVLPSVTILTIKYSTGRHTDIVEQLQLTRAFPALSQLRVHFATKLCLACGCQYSGGGGRLALQPVHQRCGGELSRGLLKLVKPEMKNPKIALEVSFSFGSDTFYDSLASLRQGKTSDSFAMP